MDAQNFEFSVPPEFWPPDFAYDEFNQMLCAEDQASIADAAWSMHQGRDFVAERARAWAGYDYIARKADRQARGLPVRLPPTDPPDDQRGYN